MNEETKMIKQQNSFEVLTAFNKIPYALINEEIEGEGLAKDFLDELTQICEYYKIYEKGAGFTSEGSNSDYIPADLKYKTIATLINKEARFLFSESPDILVEPKSNLTKNTSSVEDAILVLNDLVKTVLEKNNFEQILLKSAKDCFIGKRVAGLVNFNEEDGITISFLKSTQFLYEYKMGAGNVLSKFVAFILLRDSKTLSSKRIFKKKYVLEEDGFVWLEEKIFDGIGNELEEVFEYQPLKLKVIPACVILNDGLLGDIDGESEVEELKNYEEWFSKLSNADIDAGRKSMNPTRYTVDMDSNSTRNLSTAAGSHWDLGSDQNLDNPHPLIGMLEPAMNYSEVLKSTLDRIKTAEYEQIDMPNISIESLSGVITSGKSLKAIYWPLIVRCKEKMKTWGPQLQNLIEILIEGSLLYPKCAEKYIEDDLSPVAYKVKVTQNTPIQEDEIEEKNIDLAEVESGTMSKKSYMAKWRGLSDDEIMEELNQIAFERQIIEDSSFVMALGGNEKPKQDFEYEQDINISSKEESSQINPLNELQEE